MNHGILADDYTRYIEIIGPKSKYSFRTGQTVHVSVEPGKRDLEVHGHDESSVCYHPYIPNKYQLISERAYVSFELPENMTLMCREYGIFSDVDFDITGRQHTKNEEIKIFDPDRKYAYKLGHFAKMTRDMKYQNAYYALSRIKGIRYDERATIQGALDDLYKIRERDNLYTSYPVELH